MKKISYIILSLFLIIIIFFYWYTSNINYENNIKSGYVNFTIGTKDSNTQILNDLKSQKLISSTKASLIYLYVQVPLFSFYPGEYRVYKKENFSQLITTFSRGPFYKKIIIPSGLRISEEANVVRNELSVNNSYYQFSTTDYRNIAHNLYRQYYNFDFFKYIPENSSLEGFLYPGSYEIPFNANAKYVINLELKAFDKYIFHKYKGLMLSGSDQLSLYQNMIIASIVRRETLYNSDKPIVANIFIRRYLSGIPLGSDVTVQYALGFDPSSNSWWRSPLTQSDLEINSPYNTRLYAGLPPTPICSPGYNSIISTFKSTPNKYLFFIADKEGHLHYAVNLSGQNANIAKYL